MTDYRAALEDFTETTFTHEGKTRAVFRKGTGPAVIVIHEIPGITPHVADFGRKVADQGLTAVLPALFGEPGRPMSVPYVMKSFGPACVSKEFAALATGKTSPITVWLRALGAAMHEECGGPGIGAVGMCFTGGFALAMMVDDRMLAPVLSQPSLPLPLSKKHKADVGIDAADLARVKERADAGQPLMGLRFTCDPVVPGSRFETLKDLLGDRFISVEIDSAKGNEWDIPKSAHSVLTEHLVTDPSDHPTSVTLDAVLAFFSERLLTQPAES